MRYRYLFQSALRGVLLSALLLAILTSGSSARGAGRSQIYLPLLRSVGSAPSTGGGGAPGGAGALWLPFTTRDGGYVGTANPNIAVDQRGGIHVTYRIILGQDAGERPAYYAYCASDCTSPARWARVLLSDNVFEARLQLDSAGRPRVLLYAYVNGDGADWGALKQYQYAACDSACTDPAGWTITPIADAISYDAFRGDAANHYFALDAQGHPAFMYWDTTDHDNHGGTFFVTCRQDPVSACADVSNWAEARIASGVLDQPELVIAPDGQPRFVGHYTNVDQGVEQLIYGECDPSCDNVALTNFVGAAYDTRVSLRVDSAGHSRAVLYTGSARGGLEQQQLYYLWCDAGCTADNSWGAANLHSQNGVPGLTVDLQLDRQDHPRFVYKQGDAGPGYAWCDTGCESSDGRWRSTLLENAQTLQQDDPVQPIVSCSIARWTSGHLPALALDPQGNPRVAFGTKHQYGGVDTDPTHGGAPCPVSTDVPLARFIAANQP